MNDKFVAKSLKNRWNVQSKPDDEKISDAKLIKTKICVKAV